TDFSNSDLWRWDPDYMGAYPWDDLDVYEKCSPSTFVKKIKTPVLITHGESDNNTFISNSKEMYQALRARGANVQFVHYPREGHGNREPNHRLDEMRRCLEWMDSYLKSGPAATKSRRLGDRITKSGYELRVIRAADSEIAHLPEEHPRLLEVVFTLASDGPVEESWTFTPGQIKLEGEAGKCPFRGIPVDIGGEKRLLEGIGLRTEIHPDTDSGRLSLTAALVYEIPTEGGILELKIPRFPTVQLLVGPKESPDEKAEG
ncbi:MAG: prolyl oligopeptidase family serine peptidase, partial [Chthonomonadales bacterium]